MKLLLIAFMWILLGFSHICLGATPKASYNPEYSIREDGLYHRLGLGCHENMWQFMSNQVTRIKVGFFPQDGGGGYGLDFPYDPYIETLEEATVRIARDEFRRVLNEKRFRTDQRFAMICLYRNPWVSQFSSGAIYFYPELSGTSTRIPDATFLSWTLVPSEKDKMAIYWPGVARASIIVFNKDGSMLYKGDSKKNDVNSADLAVAPGIDLMIGRRFLTNQYTGVLTVTLGDGTSGTYLLKDGMAVSQPSLISPYVSLSLQNGKPKVEVWGGGAYHRITIQAFADLNPGCQPHAEIDLVLDNVGLGSIMTNIPSLPTQFFRAGYVDK